MGVDFQSKEEVEEYLQNLAIEYRFQCYSEKRPDGCHRLGDFLEAVKSDFAKAAVVYQMNCDTHNFPRSCFKFGNYKLLGRGCDKDPEMAGNYHEKACSLGEWVGCYQAGIVRLNGTNGAVKDVEKAKRLIDKACSEKDSESCYFLSTLYLPKTEAEIAVMDPKDAKTSFEYATKACNLNHLYGCANLYQFYTRGLGCAKDVDTAAKVKRKTIALRNAVENPEPGIVFGE